MQTLTDVKNLLDQHKKLISLSGNPVLRNYPALIHYSAMTELKNELAILNALLTDPKTFPNKFQAQCRIRYQRNAHTCLSFAAAPMSACNTLYWNIAQIIFQPQTFADMLAILCPALEKSLELDITVESLPEQLSRTKIKLTASSQKITQLTYKPEQEKLRQMIISDDTVLDLNQIRLFDLPLHSQLYSLLKEKYPAICHKLYRHNDPLSTLYNHIRLFSLTGQTPREAIQQLINSFIMGGSYLTGQHYATISAQIAYTEFKSYLNLLPLDFKAKLLTSSAMNVHTLSTCLAQLDQAHCVEGESRILQAILENRGNKLLDVSPNLTEPQKKALLKNYRYNHQSDSAGLPINGQETNIDVPDVYLNLLLPYIVLNDISSYIDFIINFPPQKYDLLLSKITITINAPATIMRLNQILTPEQIFSFCKALIVNLTRFTAKDNFINFIQAMSRNLPDEKRNQLIQELIKDPFLLEKHFSAVFSFATLHTDFQQQFEKLRPQFEQLTGANLINFCLVQNWYGVTVLGQLLDYPIILKMILDKANVENKTVYLLKKSRIFSQHFIINIPLLQLLLSYYPANQRLTAFLWADDMDDNVARMRIFIKSGPVASLVLSGVFPLLTPPERLKTIYYLFLIDPELLIHNPRLIEFFINTFIECGVEIYAIRRLKDKLSLMPENNLKQGVIALLNQLIRQMSKGDTCLMQAEQLARLTCQYLPLTHIDPNTSNYAQKAMPYTVQQSWLSKVYLSCQERVALMDGMERIESTMKLLVPVVSLLFGLLLADIVRTSLSLEKNRNERFLTMMAGLVTAAICLLISFGTTAFFYHQDKKTNGGIGFFSKYPPLFKKEVEVIADALQSPENKLLL